MSTQARSLKRDKAREAWAKVRENWQPHVGRHHLANCGNYRPVAGNDDCPNCPSPCPCGRERGGAW